MVAVRNLLSTLNSLTQPALLTSGWLPLAEGDGAAGSWEDDGEYAQGGVEPPLDELLDDPVVHLMMRADRLDPEEVRRAMISLQPER